jgi:hypothetical protein
MRVILIQEGSHIQQACSRVGHRGGRDPDRIDVAAGQAPAGDRLPYLGVPQQGAGARVRGVHRVLLGGDQHAAVHHQRLAVNRLVERWRDPTQLRAPQGRAAPGDPRTSPVTVVGGPVGGGRQRHRANPSGHCAGGRRPVPDVEHHPADLMGRPTVESAISQPSASRPRATARQTPADSQPRRCPPSRPPTPGWSGPGTLRSPTASPPRIGQPG